MPTNAFVAADMPFTSVTKLEAAVAASPVPLFETGVGMFASVIAGN
jgi:hypothetical protein